MQGKSRRQTRHAFLAKSWMSRASKRLMAAVVVAGLVACNHGSPDAVGPAKLTSASLDGTWSQVVTSPGDSLTLRLMTSDTTVTGSGAYSIDVGGTGTLTVTGTISAPRVALDLVFDSTIGAHIDATLSSADSLAGTITYGPTEAQNQPQPIVFHKSN